MFESVNVKLAGYSAAAAFVVSFFTGLLAGVSFGVIVLRALIGGALFGAATLVARMLIERYVPDLLALTTAEKEESRRSGGGIDISVGDDTDGLPASAPAAGAADDSEGGASSNSGSLFDESLIEEVAEAPLDEEQTGGSHRAEDSDGGKSTFGDGEGLPDLDGSGSFEPGLGAEHVSSGESAAPSSGDREKADDQGAQDDTDVEGIDSLDDISGSTSSTGKTQGNSEGGDPKMMAEAIRTVLKREGS